MHRKINFQSTVIIYFASITLFLIIIATSTFSIEAKPAKHRRAKAKQVTLAVNAKNISKWQKKAQKLSPKKEDDEKEENEKQLKDDPDARRDWFTFERSYPFDTIPDEGRRQAYDAFLSGENAQAEAALPEWKSIGPRPTIAQLQKFWGVTSGRINSIAISPANPKIILVGAATGGVWRSENGGETFSPVSDNQVDLAVGYIAFAPSNPDIVYAGMGDLDNNYLGTGILKSTDAGKTWQRISNDSLPVPGFIVRVEIDPTNPDRVYAAQWARLSNGSLFASGVFISTDGGVNWKRTLIGLPSDIVISLTDSQTIYAAMARVDSPAGTPAGLYRSSDGGNTWTRIYTAPFPAGTSDIRIGLTPAAPNRIYLYAGGGNSQGLLDLQFVTSKDAGTTWQSTSLIGKIDSGQFHYNTYLAVDPKNADVVYIGTRDVFKSTDAGATWANLTNNFDLQNNYRPTRSNAHPDQHVLTFSPENSSTIFIGNDGGIYKSTDAGKTFQSKNNTLSLTQFIGLDIFPQNPIYTIAGAQDNGNQLMLEDGNWYEVISGDGGHPLFSRRSPGNYFTTYVYGSITRFTNTAINVGTEPIFGEFGSSVRIRFYPPFTVSNDGRLYFGTWRLFISENDGDSWYTPGWFAELTKGNGDTINAIGVSNSDTKVIYTGSTQGRVMVTQDRGETWKDITLGIPNRTIKSIVPDAKNPGIAYLTVSGYASGHVYRTTNFGATWTNISNNLPDIPTNAFAFDPINPQIIYVGTDIGVFRSQDNGQSWERFNKGMPPVVVNALATHPSGIMRAATYGRGIYEINLNDNQ